MGLETAAIIGITSVAASAAGGAASFAQAQKQKKAQKYAERKATEAMAAASKKLDVNFLKGTSIAKEAYKLQRKANLVAAEQALTAGVESERGGAATAGRVIAQSNNAQASTAADMEGSLRKRDLAIANEDARLTGLQAEIDLGEAEGAQQAASDAASFRANALTQGIQGFTTAASTAASEFLPLYQANKKNQFAGAMKTNFTTKEQGAFNAAGGANFSQFNQATGTQKQFNQWKRSMSDAQWNMISGNAGYQSAQPK